MTNDMKKMIIRRRFSPVMFVLGLHGKNRTPHYQRIDDKTDTPLRIRFLSQT